jgi:hypothetical protein
MPTNPNHDHESRKNDARGERSSLAELREPKFPFPPSARLEVKSSFEGYAVLWYIPGSPPHPTHEYWVLPWYKIVLVHRGQGSVEIRPPTDHVLIVDFKMGFDPTPDNLHFYANEYLNRLPGEHPRPGGCPIVT